jgi:tripartite-type tricarboxylate transporter receptor subunit TctC
VIDKQKLVRQREPHVFKFWSMAFIAGLGLLWSVQSSSQPSDYPHRAITMLVPFVAGGPTDTVARIVSSHLSRTLGQRIVVENVPGSGGTVGSLRAKRSTPDGYTVLIGNMGTHAAAFAMYPRLEYDPRIDFEPIGLLASAPIVIVGRRELPAKDLKAFIAYSHANVHKLEEGHAGVGSVSFTACLLLNHILDVNPRLVPYEGTFPAIEALMLGHVDYMCDQIVNVIPQVRAGRVKVYAIAAPERSPALPDIPTTIEAGLPDYQVSAWNAMFVPKGVRQPIVEKLSGAVAEALDDRTVRKRLLDLGANLPEPDQRGGQALAALVRSEVDRWMAAIKASGY